MKKYLKTKGKEFKLTTLGFTLIELLAVIIILSIIALITVPVIMNIIERANKSAFKDSAYGIIKAGELHYADKLLDPAGMTNDITFTFPEATGLDIKGSRPKSGNMKVTKDGKIELAISNGKWCARKSLNEEEITIDNNIKDCSLIKIPNPIIITNNNCLTEGICENGVLVNVKVNDTENHNFYVIGDTNGELTLIMDRNLGSDVEWITKEDYLAAGGTKSWVSYGNNDKGPLTALKTLEYRTKNWSNIDAYDYELIDDSKENVYQPIKIAGARARLLTLTEAKNLGCESALVEKSCPEYLYDNLFSTNHADDQIAYWLSTATKASSFYAAYNKYFMYYKGTFKSYANLSIDNRQGLRPVIKISKTI